MKKRMDSFNDLFLEALQVPAESRVQLFMSTGTIVNVVGNEDHESVGVLYMDPMVSAVATMIERNVHFIPDIEGASEFLFRDCIHVVIQRQGRTEEEVKESPAMLAAAIHQALVEAEVIV